MATEPALPVRELTEDYAQDVDRLTSRYRLPDDLEPHMRAIERELSDLMGGGITVCDVLRTAIRAALDERNTALRERCDLLRQIAVRINTAAGTNTTAHQIYVSDAFHEALRLGYLVDDLRPREGDER